MFRRDYIVRMIEDMTGMIAKVFVLKQERKTTEALWEVDELLNKHFRLNSRLLNSLSVEDIIEMFRLGGGIEVDKLQGMARLLYEEGTIYAAAGNLPELLPRLMKALHLYLYAALHGADRELLGLPKEIDDCLKDIEAYRLPVKTERLLMSYMESVGRYGKAEDSLYRLMEQGKATEKEGEELYDRLLEKDPGELERGNLPLEEVRQGRQEWLKLNRQTKETGV
ncbi:DUF6483 family protein [Paenibacillus rhizophilus]|uniref:Tetratricopeptide repeat protein n=1 Tax=Paenibacillus rhizophilus TaxID=1850366 RepID=A0A3N9P1Z5_9BACL|nr:DUF6483 family protein [Paenibacillus rhizophilus]RQW09497.1 hypothetical protein EH198_18655 [Paenibacillus rhizophilus]